MLSVVLTIQVMKEYSQYPDENIIPIFYKFIYKYKSLDVKTLSDKQIKDLVSNSSLADFEKALAIIQNTGQCHKVIDNKAIYSDVCITAVTNTPNVIVNTPRVISITPKENKNTTKEKML